MEWPRVFFLDDELIPSYWTLKAVAQDPNRFQWMIQEESNIRYVAVTRAIDQLTYVRSEDWQ
jgi:superfamily I DNA/RNA helicase